MGSSATSGLSTGILNRRLVLSSRLRTFKVDGRIFAHASQVPLTYLAASTGLMDVLRQFSTPGQLQTALGSGATRDDEEFFNMLHRVGILLDADTPDPVHAMMPNHAVMRSLLLYPTNACNLRCVYCHATSGPNAGPKLSRAHLMADLADGRLVPDIGWQPMTAELKASCSAHPGAAGRLVALVPPFARAPWNQDANRRPFFPVDKNARRFFHLPRAD